MKTHLMVVATEPMEQTIGGYKYTYNHKIKNQVDLIVELDKRVTVTAHFGTRYKPTPPVPAPTSVVINVDYDPAVLGKETKFNQECDAKYAPAKCTVSEEQQAPNQGKTKITFAGTPEQIKNAIDDITANGYQTP